MAVTMAAVQQGYLMVMQKNVVTKLASKYFKQQRSKYFKQQRVTVNNTSNNFRLSTTLTSIQVLQNKNQCPYVVIYNWDVVICNCDLTCLSAMKTIVQCSTSFR